jgi:hypothetical protein
MGTKTQQKTANITICGLFVFSENIAKCNKSIQRAFYFGSFGGVCG